MPTRRQFLRTAVAGAAAARSAAAERPNILLILADDLGAECLGCYGGTSYRTPHLDKLARGGVRFTHAYAQPLCTPTRVQLMTGQYNFRNWRAFGVMDPKERTFAHVMREAGYRTAIAGKWQLYSYNPPDFEPEWRGKGMRPEHSDFHEYCLWHAEHTETMGSRYADPVILENGKYRDDLKERYGDDVFSETISSFMERNRAQPFFAYYAMALPHGPFNPTPFSKEWKTGNRLQNDKRFYADMVEYMDHCVGTVVRKVDELGLRERTLILFFSDNGSPREIYSRMGDRTVRGGKGLTIDAGTHVPLIASWKGVTPEDRVFDDLVDSTDFLPTIAEATGASLARNRVVDGRSFLARLRGERGRPREWVFSHYDPQPGIGKAQYTLRRFARTRRYKLYDDGKLYDVPADPLEERPLGDGAGGAEATAARAKLRRVLDSLRPA